MPVLQRLAQLAATPGGAILVYLVVAAMVYAIIKLATRKLRRPYGFLCLTLIAVAVCRLVYFVLLGPVLIAYLLAVPAQKREAGER